MSELRAPCQHGRYEEHRMFVASPDETWQYTFCLGGHPVEGGEKVWWCEEHKASLWDLEVCYQFELEECRGRSHKSRCRMVERFLIPLSAPKPESDETTYVPYKRYPDGQPR